MEISNTKPAAGSINEKSVRLQQEKAAVVKQQETSQTEKKNNDTFGQKTVEDTSKKVDISV